MVCPIDQSDLIITERQGIEIDYCPKCRGVWLDRGELDKIIERGSGFSHQTQPQPQQYREQQPVYREHRDYDDDDDNYNRGHHSQGHHDSRHHKKESFLGDLFDF